MEIGTYIIDDFSLSCCAEQFAFLHVGYLLQALIVEIGTGGFPAIPIRSRYHHKYKEPEH